jgi:hypothetical protein
MGGERITGMVDMASAGDIRDGSNAGDNVDGWTFILEKLGGESAEGIDRFVSGGVKGGDKLNDCGSMLGHSQRPSIC